MNITNEQIIQSARRQRQIVDSQINVEPWQPRHRRNRGIVAAIAVAASIISFIAGYGVCAKMSQHDALPLAQNIQMQHDTILQTTTIRDTVYLTRIVTKYAKPTTIRSAIRLTRHTMTITILPAFVENGRTGTNLCRNIAFLK